MPRYSYFCLHCDDVELDFPMEPGPPPTTLCPLCGRRVGRVYVPIPVQYHSPGFSKPPLDRPDERLKVEIEASQDVDPVTGLSWEETDRRLAKRKARWGHRMRKDIHLPGGAK
jgi:predicted nucleic acid-binding Zn ribbon protein